MSITIETIQVRRATAATATANNVTLLEGEIGYETDTRKVKIGDGSTAWVSLPYVIYAPLDSPALINIPTAPTAAVATNTTQVATTAFVLANPGAMGNLTGDVTSTGLATSLTNAAVIAKVLTAYSSGAGTVASTDSILQAIQKLNGNDATNANLTGPITSSGNATAIASQTGTGVKFVMDTGPTFGGGIQITGISTFSTGTGLEIFYNTGASASQFLSYDRGASAYKGFVFDALSYVFYLSGSEVVRFTTTGLTISVAGCGIKIKEGSNATMGVATLVLGVAVVSTTKVTANSRIFLQGEALGTITVPVARDVTARTAGTSFTITSSNLTDTSSVAWIIYEPA